MQQNRAPRKVVKIYKSINTKRRIILQRTGSDQLHSFYDEELISDTRLNSEYSKGTFKSILLETDEKKAAKDCRIGISLNKHSFYTGEEV